MLASIWVRPCFAQPAVPQEHGAKLQREEIESRARASCLQQHKARAGLVNLQYWQCPVRSPLTLVCYRGFWLLSPSEITLKLLSRM